MNDKQLESLLTEHYQRSVEAHAGALEGLEAAVCRRLAQAAPRRSWLEALTLPRLRLSLAFAGTALAMLVLGVFIGGVWGLPFADDGYRGVTFIVAMPEADQVAVVGDFNGWQPASLNKDSKGIWSLRLDLPPGRYEYSFVVDGQAWKPDPRADEYVKSFGFTNSVKYVSAEGETS